MLNLDSVYGGRGGADRMVVGFTTTHAISAYHHWCCEFQFRPGRGAQHYVIKFVWLVTGQWFSPGPPVYSPTKTDRHVITEILIVESGVKHHQAKKQIQ